MSKKAFLTQWPFCTLYTQYIENPLRFLAYMYMDPLFVIFEETTTIHFHSCNEIMFISSVKMSISDPVRKCACVPVVNHCRSCPYHHFHITAIVTKHLRLPEMSCAECRISERESATGWGMSVISDVSESAKSDSTSALGGEESSRLLISMSSAGELSVILAGSDELLSIVGRFLWMSRGFPSVTCKLYHNSILWHTDNLWKHYGDILVQCSFDVQ